MTGEEGKWRGNLTDRPTGTDLRLVLAGDFVKRRSHSAGLYILGRLAQRRNQVRGIHKRQKFRERLLLVLRRPQPEAAESRPQAGMEGRE